MTTMGRPATLRVDIVTDAKGASRGIDATDSRLSKFGGRAAKFGALAAKGVAAVGVAAAYTAVKVVKSASDQEQAYGALDSIYGKSSKKVKAWARTAADSVGLARGEYANLSALVGAQLQGMGFEQDKSANKSKALIKTGADLAATFGGSVSDAVGAVSSLLKGERDPIERYGVSIKQADVSARLASMGLDNLTGKAAKQAEAQAVLSLLNEQTAKSTGAFARESNTLAGQQERLGAKFENIKATVGAKLLPILVTLFTWVNNKLLPGAGRLGAELRDRFGPTITKVGAWVTGRLVPGLRSLWSWFMTKIYPSIKGAVTPILNGLKSAFGSVSSAVSRNSGQLSSLARFIGRVVEASGPLRVLMGKTLGLAFKALGWAIGATLDNVGRVVDAFGRLGSMVQWAIDKIRSLSSLNPGKLIGKLGSFIGSTPVHTMTPALVSSPRGRLGGAGLNTAALDLMTAASSSPFDLAAAGPSFASYTDARDLSVTLTVEGGALTDPRIVAQLERALEQHRTRMGRAPAFGRR